MSGYDNIKPRDDLSEASRESLITPFKKVREIPKASITMYNHNRNVTTNYKNGFTQSRSKYAVNENILPPKKLAQDTPGKRVTQS